MKLFPRLPLLVVCLLSLAAVAPTQDPAATAPILPDPKLTPGDVLDVSLADIQEHDYSSKGRNVPLAVKREVYASYGIAHWEIEPRAASARAGEHLRDLGAASDGEADTETSSAATAAPTQVSAAAAAITEQVWVNTKSGVIWKLGTVYYGKTKAGKYMSEANALAAGYHEPKQPKGTPAMHSNQKLTKIIAGRTISGTSQADGLLRTLVCSRWCRGVSSIGFQPLA